MKRTKISKKEAGVDPLKISIMCIFLIPDVLPQLCTLEIANLRSDHGIMEEQLLTDKNLSLSLNKLQSGKSQLKTSWLHIHTKFDFPYKEVWAWQRNLIFGPHFGISHQELPKRYLQWNHEKLVRTKIQQKPFYKYISALWMASFANFIFLTLFAYHHIISQSLIT